LVYAARWQIELLFKELKSHYRLGDLPSRKKHVVEALIFAALLTSLVSRALLNAVRAKLRKLADRLPEHRWATLFASVAQDILLLVLKPASQTLRLRSAIVELLLHEAVDPNASRATLINAVEMRQHQYRLQAA